MFVLKEVFLTVLFLDTKNHIINAVATNDNFSAAMKPFFGSMSAEELTNWKEFVKNADVKVYQVGTNADGSDKDITAQNWFYG